MAELNRTFIITSVIHFSKTKLPGSTARSVFNSEERTAQTIKTVNSIREKVPGATIILVEMGREKNIGGALAGAVDKYVFIGDKILVKWAVNSKNRGLGEAMGLIVSRKDLLTDADLFFKISGRYFLNDRFDLASWKTDVFSAKKYGTGISTRLYGFGKNFFTDWQNALKQSLVQLYRGRSIEDVFPAKFGAERIHDMKTSGLTGYVAPDGSLLEE